MTTVDLDNNGKAELILSFPAYGVWIYRNDATWSQLHPRPAIAIAAGQLDSGTAADLVLDFGPGFGIWTFRESLAWVQLHPKSAQGLTVADFDGDGLDDIVIGFGSDGIWKYSKNTWTFLHPQGVGGLAATGLH